MRSKIDATKIEEAEKQIRDYARTVKFTVTEYSFEFIVEKLKSERYYVPDYQRKLIWTPAKQSKFIESVLMGLPIPFVFFWQDQEGRMEIVDGSQRLRTIRDFMDNKFALKKLEALPAANGMRFNDFPSSRQLFFSETPIRAIILDNATDALTRTEMFARINTGGTTANDAEIRRGSLPGPFMDLIMELAETDAFVALTPISQKLINQREREELVTRFFAYLARFQVAADGNTANMLGYREEPRIFYFSFVEEMNTELAGETGQARLADLREEFLRVLSFVDEACPFGFTKSETGNQVPRVRYESIAVGSALALRERPGIADHIPDMTPLLESEDFAVATKSDAANVKSKLINRIEIVRSWLLDQ